MSDFQFAVDLDRFVSGQPHDEFARLRREAPISWNPLPKSRKKDDGFWLVTRHEDVVAASRNAAVFKSNEGTLLVDHPPATAPAPWSMIKNEFCSLDAPIHRTYRNLLAPKFTPRAIASMEAPMRALAQTQISAAYEKGSFDFSEALAVEFPTTVVLVQLLGLPEEDRHKAAYWSDVLSAPEDPHFKHAPDATMRAVQEMYDYAIALVQSRRDEPRDDLASVLAHTTLPDGSVLSDEMFTHYFWSMILGAFDTTAATIAGGALALIQRPDTVRMLRDDPSLISTAVEEMLRWVSAVVYFRRTASEDTTLGGQAIAKGDRVALCYPSANRDETVFEDPEVFDITRNPNPHVSFGFGPHFCLGAHLARMELRIFFEVLLAQDDWLALGGEVRHARSNFLNRIHTFPVTRTAWPR